MFTSLIKAFRGVLRDAGGNILPLAAVGMLIAALVVGSAIDFARSYRTQNQLQAACDAAALAARRSVTTNGLDSTATTAGNTYFAANYNGTSQGTSQPTPGFSSPDSGNTVNVTVSTSLPMQIVRIFGYTSMPLTVTCSSSMGVGNSDVMMVLDTTGSMASSLGNTTRIAALRTAMNNFYTTLSSSTSGSNARIRYGFVPFSTSVNVGRLLYTLNPSYLADSYTYQSRQAQYRTGTQVFDHWDYKPVAYNTSVFKTFASASTNTGTSGAAVSASWNGCIHERGTVAQSSFSYSSLTGYSPTNAYDINIDLAPTSDSATKWAPMWPGLVYNRYNVTTSRYGGTTYTETTNTVSTTENFDQPSSPCPAAARGLATMTASEMSAYANSLVATGNTYLDIGMIWGGRLLSPDGIFSSTVNAEPSNGGEVARHLIFMTDGIMEPNYTVNQAWGLEWWDRKVTSDGSSNDAARHTSRFLAACSAIKAKGIRIWVIAFTSSLSSDLTTCASDDSSYTASDAAGLNNAFQEIAKEVGELRVVQ